MWTRADAGVYGKRSEHRARQIVGTCVAAALLSALAALPSSAAAQAEPGPYALGALQVRLYYPFTGSFSPNVPANAPLFNTVIGEGWARSASDSALVLVPVRGSRGSFAGNRRVRLVATELPKTGRPRTVLRRTKRIGLMGPAGRTAIGFFVHDVGCERLRLRATLLGQLKALNRTRTVPFVCGE